MRRHTLLGSIVLASALFFAAALPAGAAVIVTQPALLNPGDQYRLAFVTSTTRDATSSNIADYNNFVNAAVNSSSLAALGATWTALVSTPTISARDNSLTNPFASTNPGVSIWGLTGHLVAGGNFPLWNTFAAPNVINVNEFGTTTTDTTAWTGSTAFGAGIGGRTMGASIVGMGNTGGAGGQRFASGFALSTELRPLFAISSILTIPSAPAPPAVPEPSSLILLSIGAFCLIGGGIRRHKNSNKSS